jgi:hypothetical protein
MGYILAKQIAKEVGCPAKILPPATVLDENGHAIRPERPPSSLLIRYVLAWLGWYFRGQMRAPSAADNALSFAEWLHRKGFGALERGFVFTAGMTAQLYGPLDAISAHSGLQWMRPSLLLTGRLERVAHIPAGFQNMWKRLAESLGFPIHFRQRIDTVSPIDTGSGYQVELLLGGQRIDAPFDHVFLACPLDTIEHPLSRALRERNSPFAATEVYSAAWRATDWPAAAPSRCYLPAAASGAVGPLLTIRQYGNRAGRFVDQLCSYAVADHGSDSDQGRDMDHSQRLEANRGQVMADMQSIVGLRNIEILHQRLWRYNIRYSRPQIEEGLPLFLEAAQGEQQVWYTGGTLSHWNIDSITDYNHGLARRFARRIRLPWGTRLRLHRFGQWLTDF